MSLSFPSFSWFSPLRSCCHSSAWSYFHPHSISWLVILSFVSLILLIFTYLESFSLLSFFSLSLQLAFLLSLSHTETSMTKHVYIKYSQIKGVPMAFAHFPRENYYTIFLWFSLASRSPLSTKASATQIFEGLLV